MSDDIIDLRIKKYPEFQNQILDSLPYGVTVQNLDRVVIYENNAAIQLLGSGLGSYCYRRWNYQDDYEDNPCVDCPGHLTLHDGESHRILREVVDKNQNQLTLEITHVPLKKEDSVEFFIEIIRKLDNHETTTDSNLAIDANFISFNLIRFGGIGGELLANDHRSNLEIENEKMFFMQLSAFWFTAIGQGSHWPSGLYGPLPVLDHLHLHSYAYSFYLKTQNIKDQRMGDEDLMICLMIVDRRNKSIDNNRDRIENFLKDYFNQFGFIEEIDNDRMVQLNLRYKDDF